jgi:hypothetical protein
MGRIIVDQVNKEWKPHALGVFGIGDEIAMFIVPGSLYWQKMVEGDDQDAS